MQLSYQKKGNYIYAKVPGESYRDHGHVKKRNAIYLGRVIDKEHNVFYNKERGVFTYDLSTGSYGEAGPEYTGNIRTGHRKKPNLILDFGDAYFLDSLIRQMHYDEVLDSIAYKNRDTLRAMAQYYILSTKNPVHAKTWYEGSFARILYPDADLDARRISRLFDLLGQEEVRRSYFKAHIEWLKKTVCDHPAILADWMALPDAIHMNGTNHAGRVRRKGGLITGIQRKSGYPVIFRIAAGDSSDASALPAAIPELAEYGLQTDLIVADAGDGFEEKMNSLFLAGKEFIVRLTGKNHPIYHEILSKGSGDLKRRENLIEFHGRLFYVKQSAYTMDPYTACACLCAPADAPGDEKNRAAKSSRQKKTDETGHTFFDLAGGSVFLSSLALPANEILDLYEQRQLAERAFDPEKGISIVNPFRGRSEEQIPGHLLVSQIAATIHLYLQKEMNASLEEIEEMFMGLRNQKAIVYAGRIVTYEGQSGAAGYYRKFGMSFPLSFDRSAGNLKPFYEIADSMPEDESCS